nr:hypothetical protein [uncultured Eisenbergiella sp.]
MNKKNFDSVSKVESSISRAVKGKETKYVVVCDYGRQPRLDIKTGKMLLKQVKTERMVSSLAEARLLKAEAVKIRNTKMNTSDIRSMKFSDMVLKFKESERYKDLDESYQDHFDNYINHFVDYFGDMDVSKISVIDMENYYRYQMERGNLASAKKNKDGTVSKKEGISVNTVSKHKTGAKKIWEYMIDAKVYGVTENIADKSNVPKVEITIDGKKKKVVKIPYNPVTLTLEELNYTLNDAIQNEFDRSVAVMIALAAIGSLRRSEVLGLKVGKVRHDEYLNISKEIWDYSGYDSRYYKEHDEFIMIDTAIMKTRIKLPKYDIVRVVAKPEPLKQILDYAMEQRQEILDITGRKLTSEEPVYKPMVNVMKNNKLSSDKFSTKWSQYQERRNKRMEKQGLTPLPTIPYHCLRHTFNNLTKKICFEWERSYNMGHKHKGDNTTDRVYNNDRIPSRDNILKYFNEHIKIDWDKAMRRKMNEEGSWAYINGSGHLIVTDEETERRKKQGKKFIFKEEELVNMLGNVEE